MGMRLGMALIAGTLGLGLSGAALAQDDATKTTYDKDGLKIATGKNFSLGLSTNLQIRGQLTDNRDVAEGADAGDSMSFYIRRLKSTISGHVYDPKWAYRMTFAWHASNTAEALEEAQVTYKADDLYNIGVGRRKSWYNVQEYTSSSAQQFVDRSIANEVFNHDFLTGAWVDGKSKVGDANMVRYHFGVFNGTSRTGNNFGEVRDFANGSGAATVNNGFRMLYQARVEMIGNGDDKAGVTRGESDLRKEDGNRDLQWVFGLGASMNQLDDSETPIIGGARSHKATVWSWVADFRAHMNGLSLGAGFFHRSVNFGDTADADVGHASGYTDVGYYAQLGYAMKWAEGVLEPAVRYSAVDRDDFNSGGRQQDDSELSVGINYFLHGHKAKLTFDATYAEARIHGGGANPNVPTVTYRLQLQLGF